MYKGANFLSPTLIIELFFILFLLITGSEAWSTIELGR
jgi:hypothetical protein